MWYLSELFDSRTRTMLIGYGIAAGIFVLTGSATTILPRPISDELFPVFAIAVRIGIAVVAATTISVLFRSRSITFLLVLFAGSISIALLFLPMSISEQNEPVIFTSSILFPFGVVVATGTAIVIAGRLLFRWLESRRSSAS